MGDNSFEERVSGLASLAEPVRLALYRFVVAHGPGVSREQAADGLGVPWHTAKFHLDRLVDEGLLDVEFRRLTGREGPGAGRPAKLYRRSEREIAVTLPDREYALAGDLLAAAIEDSADGGTDAVTALARRARERGREVGETVRREAGRRPSRAAVLRATCSALASAGYEPRVSGDRVRLANCPFHALAQGHPELVCRMNLAMLDEMAVHSGGRLTAELEPTEEHCCVTLTMA